MTPPADIPAVRSVTDADSTAFALLTEGDDLYERMSIDIAAARRTVRFSSYIWADDEIGTRFVDTLLERHTGGVAVHVAVDAFGSLRWPRHHGLARLTAGGVRLTIRRQPRWHALRHIHRRDHRKLLVCDEAIAYLGGFNLHRESSKRLFGPGRWRDTHVRLAGPLAASCAQLFDAMLAHRRVPDVLHADGLLLWPSARAACRQRFHCALLGAVAAARRRIWLTTPYFVPDRRLLKALIAAHHRGVDVRMLLPGLSDVPLVRWAAHAHYEDLLDGGVQLYEYQPRVLHAKSGLVDADWAFVGSANLDRRSFFLNDELTLAVHGTALNAMLAEQFGRDLFDALPLQLPHWRRRSRLRRWREQLAWRLRQWL